MWIQHYNPFHNAYLSAFIAALPIVLFLLCLTVFKMKGIKAAFLTLCFGLVTAVWFFHMPVSKALAASIYGIANGLWPIGYIVIMAVWLYKIAVKTGKFDIIRGSIANISEDQRLQLLLIGFSFNAFLEGAAGFGVPIAISAALLAELGFHPLKAAALCLIANAASGAFGAIGIPVIVAAQMGDLTPIELSRTLAWILPFITFLIPFLLVFILDKWKGIRETLPALLVVSGSYTIVQTLTIIVFGPELANILAALVSMGALTIFLKKWQPSQIYRVNQDGEVVEKSKYSLKKVIHAWSPFYILTAIVVIWSLPSFKALFAEGGMLHQTTLLFKVPFLHGEVVKIPPVAPTQTALDAIFKLDLVSATGTAILLAVLFTGMFSKNITFAEGVQSLKETCKELWIPVLTICFIMGFANLANYAGLSSAIGLALAKTGNAFPFVSPLLGWLGVFITGSVVSNNALFGHLQVVTGTQIGTNSSLLLAANTSGGVMGKLISPQSIAIATAAVQETGRESNLFKMTIYYSLILLLFVGVWTYVLSIIGLSIIGI
ncbi:L-lactate permease [Saccharococcus caldoxylosilyticus]|uniref:L-lactate permease n=1 Tax=Parageobacillus caldoxylosilyticus NBRC 107762 TaxID=1220594 RepID=A0A023DIK0_9BACL|nr:L-lactate permease [Parageobacillus caldoxylosilyticus]MBB3853899.1 lactate permease [Parageobacillus caldoxylosilyticus]GAJ40816.1 L-lactate permease [Parageobacillus caldoxylosilyticus NBRC 107762]